MERHSVYISYSSRQDAVYKVIFERLIRPLSTAVRASSPEDLGLDEILGPDDFKLELSQTSLRDSTVTVVLVGTDTWKSKQVDWEIAASIESGGTSSRSGVLGILLPTYPRLGHGKYDPYTIPPRLYDNVSLGYARIYDWTFDPVSIYEWIHSAHLSRGILQPDNRRTLFTRDQTEPRWSQGAIA